MLYHKKKFTELFSCGSSAQVHSELGDLHIRDIIVFGRFMSRVIVNSINIVLSNYVCLVVLTQKMIVRIVMKFAHQAEMMSLII